MDINDYNLEFFEDALKQLPSMIYLKDIDCKYVFCTHYWRHLKTDGTPNWTIKGKTDLEVRKDIDNAILAHEQDKKILETGEGCQYTITIKQDGITEYLEIIKKPVFKDGKIVGIIGLINDITQRIKLEKELATSATTDFLTGLYNRRYLDNWLENMNEPRLYPLTLISADCNGLKYINDTYGHHIGDDYIKISARILKRALPSESVIFRMGGDEFLAIVPNTNEEEAIKFLQRLEKIASICEIKDESISISYGISTVNSIEEDFSQHMKIADEKMYEEKDRIHKVLRRERKP